MVAGSERKLYMQTGADSSMVCIMLKLKGKNQIEALTEIAERLAGEISRIEGVVGMVFSGGLARGLCRTWILPGLLLFLVLPF